MGNQKSQIKKNDDDITLPKLIDYLASKYILTQNFQDMKNLQNEKYCNDLTILTSEILGDRLTFMEIDFLNQRTKQGISIDELSKDQIVVLKKEDLHKLDVQNSIKKKRMCIGIARFYIKIAHLFSAIVATMNPVYSYKDKYGQEIRVPFMERNTISKENREKSKLSKVNLCTRRIQSIIINEIKQTDTQDIEYYEVKNNICNMNSKIKKDKEGYKIKETKSLLDEPGIPELAQLYMDVFDYTKQTFVGMSKESKKAYDNDLKTFYKAFTGNSTMPKNIQRFSDIPLRDYHNHPSCNDNNHYLSKSYHLELRNKLLENYGKQIATMTKNMNMRYKELTSILDELFVYRIHPGTKNKEITLHPKLNYSYLDKLIEKARTIIVTLYIDCENDFFKSLEIFESVIEHQIQKNIDRKIKNLKDKEEEIIAEF